MKTLISFGLRDKLNIKGLLKNNSLSNFLNFGIWSFLILWLVIPFVGFHPHHDGLMLSTITLTRDAIIQRREFPFNQYGPFWVLVYALPATLFKVKYAFILSRVITVLLYLFSAFLLIRIARNFQLKNLGAIAIFLAGITHTFGLEPLPWPSSIAIPLILSITYLFLSSIRFSGVRSRFQIFASGAITVALIFTRAQVGFATLLVSMCLLVYFRRELIRWYLAGVISFLSGFMALLASLGWLGQSFTDEFVFGFSFIQSDIADKPKPFYTIIFTIIFLLCFIFTDLRVREKYLKSSQIKDSLFILSLVLGTSALSINYLVGLKSGLTSSQVIVHRLWVSFLLAGVIYALLISTTKVLSARKNLIPLPEREILFLITSCFAVVAEIQIYPLFDPMHAWWAAFPAVLVISIILRERFLQLNHTKYSINLTKILILSLVILTSLPFIQGSSRGFRSLSSADMTGVYLPQSNVDQYQETRNFFTSHIDSGDRVLNLCPDSDVFFIANFASPASRVFIYWDAMFNVKDLMDSLKYSNPDKIVLCSTGVLKNDLRTKSVLGGISLHMVEIANQQFGNQKVIILKPA